MSFVKGLRMPRMRPGISRQTPGRLRRLLRSTRSRLRLRCHRQSLSRANLSPPARKSSGDIANCCPWKPIPSSDSPADGRRWFAPTAGDAKLGLDHLYLKNDSVSYPTLSFKDRVTAMAVNKAIEFKLEAVGCASTGNLANSVAANAAAAGLPAFILIPESLERSKITATQIYGARVIAVRGNYDDVNRLCSQIAERHPWGFVNVNLRPFYAEGSKTIGYEIAEQLGWQAPTPSLCRWPAAPCFRKSTRASVNSNASAC